MSLRVAFPFAIFCGMNNTTEVFVALKNVGRYFAHQPKLATVRFWMTTGLLNGHGERVLLETRLEGGRRYTTESEIRRFKENVQKGR